MPARKATFFDRNGTSNLVNTITPKKPWVYFSMELYDTDYFEIKGSGGLGVLAADLTRQAKKLEVPLRTVSLFYPQVCGHVLHQFEQSEQCAVLHPEDFGFEQIEMDVHVKANEHEVPLKVYKKENVLVLYEAGLQQLYHGSGNSEHRIYQEMVLGFGGIQALSNLSLSPSVIHLNESSTSFAAVAYLDQLVEGGMKIDKALEKVRQITILTNHTLVAAAMASFPKDYYERYVLKNIRTQEVRDWLTGLIDASGGELRIGHIGMALAGKNSGVSKFHAQIASKNFTDIHGKKITFTPVTNGIFLDRWIHPELLLLYRKGKFIDEYDLAEPNAQLSSVTPYELRRAKHRGKEDLYEYLQTRRDQYGNAIELEYHDQIAVWARRFAGYKRPWMMFDNPDRLMNNLVNNNFHLLLSGTAHPNDHAMKEEIKRVIDMVDSNSQLRERVHFIQNYDDELAMYLAQGSHIFINTPEVGSEACGTSWMKAMGNCSLVISTRDGGIADIEHSSFMEVKGDSYSEEVESMYGQFEKALEIINSDKLWHDQVLIQLKAYLSIISGARMLGDYLRFIEE